MFDFPWVAFFVLGSPFTWLLFVAAFCLLTWVVEKEEYGFSAFVFFVLGLTMLLFGDGLRLLGLMVNNPWPLLAIVGLYFAGSGIWGLVKWYLYTSEKLEVYKQELNEWLRNKGVMDGTLSPENKELWKKEILTSYHYSQYVRGSGNNKTVVVRPAAWEHKKKITMWMLFWPSSLVWTLLDDVVVRIVKRIQRALSGMMDSITNAVWRGVDL